MIRLVATLCFALTLLCPVFCLAADDGCAAGSGEADRNCEAMAVGAVVAEAELPPLLEQTPQPAWNWAVLALHQPTRPLVGLGVRSPNRATCKPPPAATRQALLQTFLF